MAEPRFNQETNPRWNREPGVVLVPGSNLVNELAKHEQYPSKFTVGTVPGNPYQYREFPKMLYRAEHWNGKIVCMAAPPDDRVYANPGEYAQVEEQSQQFTKRCQRIVNDEEEMTKAMESGWRQSAVEAVEYLQARDKDISTATAQRNREDQNMSEPAKREIKAQIEAAGGEHQPEITAKPVRRGRRPNPGGGGFPTKRRGRPKGSKNRKKAV